MRTERGKRQGLDVFHHQIGKAFLGRSAVKQASDVGVVERGENLALVLKAREEIIRAARSLDEFDGDLLIERSISADRAEDISHAAAGDFSFDAVGRDKAADPA